MIMDKPVSTTSSRRSITRDDLLPGLVERLTERGIIRPEEAEDMLALLTAFSDESELAEASKDNASSRRAHGFSKSNASPAARGEQPGHRPPRRSW